MCALCIYIFLEIILVGAGQANEALKLSVPAYYLLPPSVSSLTFYINITHFLTEPQCILNITHHPHCPTTPSSSMDMQHVCMSITTTTTTLS